MAAAPPLTSEQIITEVIRHICPKKALWIFKLAFAILIYMRSEGTELNSRHMEPFEEAFIIPNPNKYLAGSIEHKVATLDKEFKESGFYSQACVKKFPELLENLEDIIRAISRSPKHALELEILQLLCALFHTRQQLPTQPIDSTPAPLPTATPGRRRRRSSIADGLCLQLTAYKGCLLQLLGGIAKLLAKTKSQGDKPHAEALSNHLLLVSATGGNILHEVEILRESGFKSEPDPVTAEESPPHRRRNSMSMAIESRGTGGPELMDATSTLFMGRGLTRRASSAGMPTSPPSVPRLKLGTLPHTPGGKLETIVSARALEDDQEEAAPLTP